MVHKFQANADTREQQRNKEIEKFFSLSQGTAKDWTCHGMAWRIILRELSSLLG
jgi:hypothetical protein